ncbi:saccharopine dehydrogenase family protein [Umezawaea endophytica]|uniref:Saccharopine dehydrogenase NADP-binding domain-containing protein n=1 Tax=Umezawaea endophytica TaxID=1654476 RepID=A0A9X2VGX8_9PSEU|nr:saccharopine dehydrogenase NADP-binding domain-containing protein [Umezawaea endophytica]MCS7476465.1 saccharopine dehydrogenase NADP-binding domain-containing protein [Umezawaea endophytica]
MTWMLYGANGYTGELIAELAVRRGQRPVLAGRSAVKVAAVAERLGLEHVVFELADAAENLRDTAVVVHCAGPFSTTSRPVVDACLASGTHYVDITGEIDVFEAVASRDVEAKAAGVALVPGAGFDVVPTDCLAALLKAELPGATHLDLAFLAGGGASPGTSKTSVEGSASGGRARVDGELRNVRIGHRRRSAAFRSGAHDVGSIPWGDVSTAYRSTGIPNITTFTDVPGLTGQLQAIFGPLLRTSLVQRLGKAVAQRISGPNERARGKSRSEFWGEVSDVDGHTVSIAMTGPNGYDLTADAVLRAVDLLLVGGVPAGAHTPSSAFGADFVRTLDGVTIDEPVRT